MVPTDAPPKDDTGCAQAAGPQVNFTRDTNIPQGILRKPYPKTSYLSSSKTKWQKPEKVIKCIPLMTSSLSDVSRMPRNRDIVIWS
jgi:hypothetical protein